MGKKLKHVSTKMKGLRPSGKTGLWEARKAIPVDVRHAFGGRYEFTAALNTKSETEAMRRAAPMLADWTDQIDAVRAKAVLATAPIQRQAIIPERAMAAIQRWKSATIKDAHTQAFNGFLEAAPVSFGDDMLAHHRFVGLLNDHDWSAVNGFDARLSDALNSQGVLCDPLHPAIPAMRSWFCEAWATVEATVMEYRRGNLSSVPVTPAPVQPVASEAPPPAVAAPNSGMKLMAVFDLWESAKGSSEKRHRGYVQRLCEFLGDPDIADITAVQMDAFLVQLRRFPKTRRDIEAIPFLDAIEQSVARDDYGTLHIKTVWNWTVVYKAMFEFAVERDLIRKNPAAKMMKKPSAEESETRAPYEPDDIAAIFTANMFQGFSGPADFGYRDIGGSTIVRDHKYWLPILALWTGCRIEELATLDKAEIKTEDGIPFIDLTARPLKGARRVKNRSAKRIVPIHDKLVALGFMKHVTSVNSGAIFADLDMADAKVSADFGKWWGRWCEAHAPVKGEGLDDPSKVFHSFRHAWKRAARRPDIQEQFSDMISGHEGGNPVARNYGRGVDPAILKVLKSTMDQIDYPTFPKLP